MTEPLLRSWATRISRADSLAMLDRLMSDWYEGVKADRSLRAAVGFQMHMEQQNWEGAKGSIERTYGRSSRDHQSSLDTLAAAILSRRLLGHRLAE